MNDRKNSVKRVTTLNLEEQKKVDELIKNETKKNDGLSGGMCFFLFVLGLLALGTLAIPFSDRSGSGSPYPGSDRDNPMHEGR